VVIRAAPTVDEIWSILAEVPDPEVPALSVVDLGIVRAVHLLDDEVVVDITPTYSGCPAMHEIERGIIGALSARGVRPRVQVVLGPAWTTDWMSDAAREKLRLYGIAPPGPAHEVPLVPLMRRSTPLACPFCGQRDTEVRSDFGSTACKSLHFCNACHQPFEHFKAI